MNSAFRSAYNWIARNPGKYELTGSQSRQLFLDLLTGRAAPSDAQAERWQYDPKVTPIAGEAGEEPTFERHELTMTNPFTGDCIKLKADMPIGGSETPYAVNADFIPSGYDEFDSKRAGYSFSLSPKGRMGQYIPPVPGADEAAFLETATWTRGQVVREIDNLFSSN